MNQHEDSHFDKSSITKAINPEIRIPLPNNLAFKNHPRSLGDVIADEIKGFPLPSLS